jgi:hypothetical protein
MRPGSEIDFFFTNSDPGNRIILPDFGSDYKNPSKQILNKPKIYNKIFICSNNRLPVVH